MKFIDRKNGLKGLILLSESPKAMKNNSFFNLFVCGIVGLSLLLYALFISEPDKSISRNLIFLFSGIWLTMAYVKFTEAVGIDMLSSYLDKKKIEADLALLGGDIDFERKVEPAIKNFLKQFAWWFFVGYIFYYVFSQ